MLKFVALLVAVGGVSSIAFGVVDGSANDIVIGVGLSTCAGVLLYRSRQLESQAIVLSGMPLILAIFSGLIMISLFIVLAASYSEIVHRLFFIGIAAVVAAFIGYLLWQNRRLANSENK